MPTKKAGGWSANLRQSFNLVPEGEEPVEGDGEASADKAVLQPLTPPPLVENSLPYTTQERRVPTTDFVPLTTPASASQRGPGRPKSTVERYPKTIYLTTTAERALRRAVEQIQDWRGRQRGVPKAQESDATNIALEYLYCRMQQGAEAAEEFYRTYQATERARNQSAL